MFPDVSAGELLDMIDHYWARASEAVDDSERQLAGALSSATGRDFVPRRAVGVARKVQRTITDSKSRVLTEDLYRRSVEATRQGLALPAEADVEAAWRLLVSYSDAQYDHKMVVVLTQTLLEKLLDDLLVTLLVARGAEANHAEAQVESLRTVDAQRQLFASTAGIGMLEALSNGSDSWFFPAWEDVRQKRNSFIHGQPFAWEVK
jgi:hypothetical protein